jgi:hypothetical protein
VKTFTAYTFGVATVAIAHCLGSGAPGKLGFVLGTLATLLVLARLLTLRNVARRAGYLLLRITQPPQKTIKVKTERKFWTPPAGDQFVMLGARKVRVDSNWQDFRKLSKRAQMDYTAKAWHEVGQQQIARRAVEQKERLAAMKPGDPNYDFLNDPELCA